jgi:hypothetical protein
VPIVITSLGAKEWVNEAIHSYGGIVLHDIINNRFAKKAIEKGADGLIAVAAGAGGHAGTTSPFALMQEIREWFDGPLLLSGSIATGDAVLAAQAMGADLGYIGSAFIATDEANAEEAYKQAIVDYDASDIVYSNLFTGVHGNYLASPRSAPPAGSGQPARERSVEDGLRLRWQPGCQGLEGHLGLRPGYRRREVRGGSGNLPLPALPKEDTVSRACP